MTDQPFIWDVGTDIDDLSAVFSRASAGRYKASTLLITSEATAERDSHYDKYAQRGLLLEGERANGLTYSADLSNAAWTKTRSTVTTTTGAAPDGNTGLSVKVLETAVTNTFMVERDTPALTDTTTQALSFFAKAAERTWCWFVFTKKDAAYARAYVNLSTGAVGASSVGLVDIRVTYYGNGWYRIEASFSSAAGGTTPHIYIGPASADETNSYAGDITKGVYIWGVQFEVDKPWPSSYIPTTTGAVTRNADILYFPYTQDPRELTAYVRFVELGTIRSTGARVIELSDASDGDAKFYIHEASGYYTVTHDPSAAVTSTLAAAPDVGDLVELRATLTYDGKVQIHQSINGAAESSGAQSGVSTLGAAWAAERLYVNSVGTASPGFAAFQAVKILNGIQTLATCRSARDGERVVRS